MHKPAKLLLPSGSLAATREVPQSLVREPFMTRRPSGRILGPPFIRSPRGISLASVRKGRRVLIATRL